MEQIRGDDWTINFSSLAWSDGTTIASGELATATFRATVAGIALEPSWIAPDPESGVRLRLEVPRALTADVRPRTKPYKSDVELTINNKRSSLIFEVTVVADVTV